MKNKEIVFVFVGLVVGLIIGIPVGMNIQTQRFSHEIIRKGGSHMMPDGSIMSNNHDTDMSSMMHDMNKGLEGKTGDIFDQAFLSEMIVHHQGAVEMAQKVLQVSKRPELLKLANDIISAQNKEIEMMKGWQTTWAVK